MDQPTLKLEPRTITGKKVKRLRADGLVPASICGRGINPENFVVDAKEFGKLYQRAGRNLLIELQTPSGARQAFVRQVQRHPTSGKWIHVDFRVVDLRTPMVADVPITLVGENALVKSNDGIANQILSTLHVRALPADLPQVIEADISGITDFNTVLHVSDLTIDQRIEVLTPPEEPVASITASTTAAEDEEITEQEQLGEPELSEDADGGAGDDIGGNDD